MNSYLIESLKKFISLVQRPD